MKVLLSGATGLVGTAVGAALWRDGHEVGALVRREPRPGEVRWDPAAGDIDQGGLAGFDAVVHLAGENIAEGRWTDAKKARIRDSRVDGTALLCTALAAQPPKVFVGASAIGYYGNRGDAVMTEDSAPGDDFLADTCVAWERSSDVLAATACRVVRLRIGVVLSRDGGALQKMLLPFKLGLGGRVGSGRQYVSWITLDDLVAVILRALSADRMAGPHNAVAPEPVSNRELTATLAKVLRRPAILPVPAAVLRLGLGEMADALLLSSTRVVPAALTALGHEFAHPNLEAALRAVLDRPG